MGDKCLTRLAQGVNQIACRSTDLVARYGGEEFVVILPNTDLNGAIMIAEEIQSAVKKLNIIHQNSDISDIVTISIGVSSLIPTLVLEPTVLVQQADVALYRAKQQGRNRFVVFST
jgi:diguanylate cyclase (GGDEF)-like protein